MLITGSYVFTDTFTAQLRQDLHRVVQGRRRVDHAARRGRPTDDFAAPIPAVGPRPRQAGARRRRGRRASIFDQSATILNKQGKPFHKGGAPQFLGSASLVDRFEEFTFVQGHKPIADDQIALDKSTADKEHFALGDRVQVQATTGKRSYKLVGIVKLGGVDSFGGASVALLTLPAAQLATGKVGHSTRSTRPGKPGVNAQALSADIRAVLPPTVEVRTGAQQAAKQSSDLRDNLGFLTTALLVFAGIALFVGAFLIFNTFSITVAQRMREMALLRTLGATRRQIRRSVLAEGLVLGVLGSILGIGLGLLAAVGLKALFGAIGFDVPSSGMVIESRTIIVSLVVGVGVTMVATLAPGAARDARSRRSSRCAKGRSCRAGAASASRCRSRS